MRKLQDVQIEDLRTAFHEVTRPKAVKRLAMAIAYLDGVPVDTLSERYGIPRSTVYAWLDRFETESIEAAIRDEARPGRPAELEPHEVVELADEIADGPRQHGFDPGEWTARLLKQHISRTYSVDYSAGHARRLLRQLDPDRTERTENIQ